MPSPETRSGANPIAWAASESVYPGAKPEQGAPGGSGGGGVGGGVTGGVGGVGGADGGVGGAGGRDGGGWGGEGGEGGHGGGEGGDGGEGGSGGRGHGEGWRGGAGGEGGGPGSAGGDGQLSRLWSNTAGEHAGHSSSTYCSHSRRCLASPGIAYREPLQALRACSHTSRHVPSGAPNAQPSIYAAHTKLFSALAQEWPSSQVGMLLSCLPTSASCLITASPKTVVGAE